MLKRILFFVYGTISYLIFFGTFLYAIGFIGNFGVPSTLDGAATGPLAVSLAIDVALLTLFAVQHSVMARKWFKEWWTRIVPKPIERSTYVLFSSLALILLFVLWRPLGGVIWSVEDPVGRIVLRSLFAFGWGLVLFSTFLINHSICLGCVRFGATCSVNRKPDYALRPRDHTSSCDTHSTSAGCSRFG